MQNHKLPFTPSRPLLLHTLSLQRLGAVVWLALFHSRECPQQDCGRVLAVCCPHGEDGQVLSPQPPAWPELHTHTGIFLVRRLGLLWLWLIILELCFLALHRVNFCTEDAKKPSPTNGILSLCSCWEKDSGFRRWAVDVGVPRSGFIFLQGLAVE